MLYSQRQRESQRAEAEARGESFWTDHFTAIARNKLWVAFTRVMGGTGASAYRNVKVAEQATKLIKGATGLLTLVPDARDAITELGEWLAFCDDAQVPDILEASVGAVEYYRTRDPIGRLEDLSGGQVAEAFSEVLYEERISYRFVGHQVVPVQAQELHVSVVEPAVQLLAGDARFPDAQASYVDALREISSGNPADAITDATRALEQVLAALGCNGSSIGPRLADAVRKGLLSGPDGSLLQKIGDWANAVRGNLGDAHTTPTLLREDAWLAVHVVGAFIVRIAARP
jgi:hypothetical protein